MSQPRTPAPYVGNLPVEIIIDIAEVADLATVYRLTATSKAIRSIILSHEKSIVKAKLSRFTMPAVGAVMSSSSETREAIEGFTLAVVSEFHLRDQRIDSILNGGFLSTGSPDGLGLSEAALLKMKEGLKRSMYITDRLADVEADCILGTRKIHPLDHAMINYMARTKQISIIQQLPTEDLAFLAQLTSLAAMGFARYKELELRSDPGAWDKVTAFRELVLRNGSLLVWAYVRGAGSLHRFMESAVRHGVREIRAWEEHQFWQDQYALEESQFDPGSDLNHSASGTASPWISMSVGHRWPPGLHMTMIRELRNRLRCKVDDYGTDEVWGESQKLVYHLIGNEVPEITTEDQ